MFSNNTSVLGMISIILKCIKQKSCYFYHSVYFTQPNDYKQPDEGKMIIQNLGILVKKLKKQWNENPKILCFIEYWHKYFSKTSIHGLRFLFRKNINKYERYKSRISTIISALVVAQLIANYFLFRWFWFILIVLSSIGVFFVSNNISFRYNLNSLSTVVDSQNFHVSNVRFPAITLCNANRLNYKKLNETIERYFIY